MCKLALILFAENYILPVSSAFAQYSNCREGRGTAKTINSKMINCLHTSHQIHSMTELKTNLTRLDILPGILRSHSGQCFIIIPGSKLKYDYVDAVAINH